MASYKPIKMSRKTDKLDGDSKSLVAEAIEGCDDLLIKILLFLPARPLFRFKLVSKRWSSIISEPRFASLWRPKASPSGLLTFSCEDGSSSYKYDYIPLKDKTHTKASFRVRDFLQVPRGNNVEILKSCGGLFLCCSMEDTDEYYISNPTTKQFTTLPRPNLPYLDMSLAFDHSISPHYKVIHLSSCFQIEIYTSETNSWKLSSSRFPQLDQCCFRRGDFFIGGIFWIFFELGSFCYFDIDREIFRSCPVPKMKVEYIGSIHEHLYLVGSEWRHFNIFELGNDRSSWCLKYHIDRRQLDRALSQLDTNHILPRNVFYFLDFKLLSVMEREGNEEPYLVFWIKGNVFVIDLKDYTCSELGFSLQDSPGGAHHVIENPFWVVDSRTNACVY